MSPLMTLLFVACSGPVDDSGVAAAECGDPDGFGADTGDIPNVLGNWTSSFGQAFYDPGCTAENFDQTSESWIGSFELDGRAPDALYLTFGSTPERYWGAMDQNGGITLTGQHVHSAGTLYAQFGGLVYHDQYLDRNTIEGSAFLGLDVDGDQQIDCRSIGSWKAYKSGL